MPPVLDQICREIGLIHPPFVFWTGDAIQGYGDTPAEANAEYDAFLRSAALTGVPVYNAVGNHEFGLDAALLPVYQKRMGPLYGSFDYGHSHFVALNTTPVSADGRIGSGTLDDAQWNWLAADLEAHRGAANTFVFLHHYVFGPPQDDPGLDSGWASRPERDRFHALMVQHKVRAVFCGHNHIYWHGVKDGIHYFISGGAGAPLDASPEQGGYLHYLAIQVDGTLLSTQILQPWHLQVDRPDGDSPQTTHERAWVANTNDGPVRTEGLTFHLASLPAGQTYTVTAGVSYKAKTSPAEAHVVSVTPAPDGHGVTVVVAAMLKPQRTTEITVSPGTTPGIKPVVP